MHRKIGDFLLMRVLLVSLLALVIPLSQEVPEVYLASALAPKMRTEKSITEDLIIRYRRHEIESLANLREYYIARMTRYRNRALRIEFQEGGDLELARQLLQHAEQLESIVKQIEMELVRLERELRALLN
jgi:hypothetical protein